MRISLSVTDPPIAGMPCCWENNLLKTATIPECSLPFWDKQLLFGRIYICRHDHLYTSPTLRQRDLVVWGFVRQGRDDCKDVSSEDGGDVDFCTDVTFLLSSKCKQVDEPEHDISEQSRSANDKNWCTTTRQNCCVVSLLNVDTWTLEVKALRKMTACPLVIVLRINQNKTKQTTNTSTNYRWY